MKKASIFLFIALTNVMLLVSCSKDKTDNDTKQTNNPTSAVSEDNKADEETNNLDTTDTSADSKTPDQTSNDTNKEEATTPTTTDLPAEDSNEENSSEDTEEANTDSQTVEENKESDRNPTASISDTIPEKYTTYRADEAGKIEYISYQTYDYYGDQSEITKHAYVYLPYNYDESKQYNVLYLMHGIGGNEKEWGMFTDGSKVKLIMDNLIYHGDIEPFIIVVPNGRSSAQFANTSSDHNSFYKFGQELRNDLIPYIEKNYATYADYSDDGYDLTASRDHRAMAGLSMGAMQTINIGICESLDIISSFGAFSACPTTYTASQIATALKKFPDYNIRYFYNLCGTEDGIAITHASAAVKGLANLTDKLIENENFMWHTRSGGHDFNIWYLGFYNFAQVAF